MMKEVDNTGRSRSHSDGVSVVADSQHDRDLVVDSNRFAITYRLLQRNDVPTILGPQCCFIGRRPYDAFARNHAPAVGDRGRNLMDHVARRIVNGYEMERRRPPPEKDLTRHTQFHK